MLRIGVISDTHGLLRPEVEQRLAGVAHIVHVGEIGSQNVIAGLQRIAPIIAIRGNVDTGHWAEQYPSNDVVCMATPRTVFAFLTKSLGDQVALAFREK